MAKKSTSIEEEVPKEEVVIDESPLIIPKNSSTSSELNLKTAVPSNVYDCVVWDSNNIPLDVAASRAYIALKIGGIFIVDKKHPSVSVLLDVLLALFEVQDSKGDNMIFVKER